MNRIGWVFLYLLVCLPGCGKDARPTGEIPVAQSPASVVEQQKEPEPVKAQNRTAKRQKAKEALNALVDSKSSSFEDPLGVYASKLVMELSREWEVPATVSPSETQSLADRVEVLVRFSESGHVESFQFLKKSGNLQFDESVEDLLKRFQVQHGGQTLPLPEEPSTRSAVIQHGLNLKGWHHKGE